jgi:hypothetical protein
MCPPGNQKGSQLFSSFLIFCLLDGRKRKMQFVLHDTSEYIARRKELVFGAILRELASVILEYIPPAEPTTFTLESSVQCCPSSRLLGRLFVTDKYSCALKEPGQYWLSYSIEGPSKPLCDFLSLEVKQNQKILGSTNIIGNEWTSTCLTGVLGVRAGQSDLALDFIVFAQGNSPLALTELRPVVHCIQQAA